jgi:zinc protease
MEFARDYLAGVYPIQSETADQVAGRVLAVAGFGLPADYNTTYPDKIRAVTSQDVKAMAQKYMTADDLDIVLAGNVGAFRDALKKEFPAARFDEIAADQIDLLAPDLRKAGSATPAPTPVTLAQGRQILLAAANAAGGDALKSVNALTMSEQEQMIGPNGGGAARRVDWSVAYPDRCRAEVKANDMTVLQVADGKSAWVQLQSQTRDATSMLGEFERGVALFGGGWELYREILDGKLQGHAIGEEPIDSKTMQAVAVQSRFGSMRLYFDPQTHLLAAARYESATSKGAVDTEQRWWDYRQVGGRQFAFSTAVYREGLKYMESSVQDLKINPPLADSLFAAPQDPAAQPAH